MIDWYMQAVIWASAFGHFPMKVMLVAPVIAAALVIFGFAVVMARLVLVVINSVVDLRLKERDDQFVFDMHKEIRNAHQQMISRSIKRA